MDDKNEKQTLAGVEEISVVNVADIVKQREALNQNKGKRAETVVVKNKFSASESRENATGPGHVNKLIAICAFSGLIPALLGFFNKNFFYIAPLGPIIVTVVWLMKKYFSKFNKYDDNIFRS
jgi:hypothetical protein